MDHHQRSERELDVVLLARRHGVPWYVNYPARVNGPVQDHLERFCEHVRSFLPPDDRGRVTASTAHSYKGREQQAVIVLDAVARSYPLLHPQWVFLRVFGDSLASVEAEERRLFYVAMTRAQHKLFLTFAEIYGDNTTKTKPSQFLLQLDIENNPLVNLVSHDIEEQAPALIPEDRIDQVKHEYQMLASKYVSQMQLKSAIEKIIELALLEHIRSGKSLDDFVIENFLAGISVDRVHTEARLKEERVPLVDRGKIHFSASSLKMYKECPLKYKFHQVLAVPSPPKTYFDLGTAVHSTVEVLSRRQIDEQGYLPTKEDALKMLDHYWVSSAYENKKKEEEDKSYAEKMLDFFVKWCSERMVAGYTPFAAEKKFEIDLAGKKVVGFIDRIDMTPSGEYEVFDYKTGRSSLTGSQIRTDIQMNLYSLAIERLYGKLPSSANLLYLRRENKMAYDLDSNSVAEAKKSMVELIEDILAEKFEPRPEYNTCRFCDYWSICEAKEVEGEES